MTYLSVIIPSYNSSVVLKNNIPYLKSGLDKKGFTYEIIIVDDGSDDNTAAAAKELACKYLKNPTNMGKGAALKKGMLHAEGKFRIFTDADIPFEADAFGKFLYSLDKEDFALAIGDRTLAESSYHREIPGLRKIASSWFSFLVGRFVAGGMFDTQCGLKGFRADVAEDLFGVSRINGFTIDVEILSIALKRNYTIKRLPVTLRSQEGTSVKILKHSFTMIIDLFRIKINHVFKKYKKVQSNKLAENLFSGY
ncbi:MAG TPA: glycosyltransferase [Bacteroidia bacterium]|jgi:dolichyl-phosphate beta-glucosyltransferase|nr:glycosyltransferase [Bacteroidia bacterium]